MSLSRFFSIGFVILLSVSFAIFADAAPCGRAPATLDAFETADAVVTGELLGKSYGEGVELGSEVTYLTARFLVGTTYKGPFGRGDTILFDETFSEPRDRWSFDRIAEGEHLLLYLQRFTSKDGKMRFRSIDCGRTKALNDADQDLAFLDRLAENKGRTRLYGNVLKSGAELEPFADLRIRISGPRVLYTRTDSRGNFDIFGLPAGTYRITPVTKQSWKTGRYKTRGPRPARLALGGGETAIVKRRRHTEVTLVTFPDNFVRGLVTGPDGRPLANACVTLKSVEGPKLRGFEDCTGVNGYYEIRGVPSGRYTAVVNSGGAPTPAQPFGEIFFASPADESQPGKLRIVPTAEGRSVNIRVASLLPEIPVAGRVVYSDGRPAANTAVTVTFIDGVKRLKTDVAGRFSTTSIGGAQTTLSATASFAPERVRECANAREISVALAGKTQVFSNIVDFAAGAARDDLLLTLPVPSCRRQ